MFGLSEQAFKSCLIAIPQQCGLGKPLKEVGNVLKGLLVVAVHFESLELSMAIFDLDNSSRQGGRTRRST